MREKIWGIIKTKTFYQSGITSSATIINGILGLLFYTFLGRNLGALEFGIFAVAVTAISLIADIANVGTDTGIVNFVGRHYAKDKDKALKFLKLGLEVKILVGLIVIILGWFLAPWVATSLLTKSELIWPLRFSLLGAFTALLFSYGTSALQAVQRFVVWSFVNIGGNLLRLISVVVLFFVGVLTFQNTISIYIFIPLVGFFVSLIFLPKFFNVKNERKVAGEFFKYNKWVAIFTVIAAVSTRLDTFLATRYLTLKDVGIYSVAVTLASVIPQIVFAIATVVAPKLAEMDTKKKAGSYLKKLQLFVLGLSFTGVLVGIPVGYFVISRFYGVSYLPSFTPFIFLLIAQAIFLVSIPVHTAVIYYFSNPKLFVPISLVHLIVIAGLGSVLINSYGIIGAAVTVLIGNISNFLIPAIWTVKEFRK